MIKVVKKDGTKEDFNVQKIVVAVNKSAYRALIKCTEEELDFICKFVEEEVKKMGIQEIQIAQMHNVVEGALEKVNPVVAKSYRDYRNYKQDFVQMLDDVYKKSQSIMYIKLHHMCLRMMNRRWSNKEICYSIFLLNFEGEKKAKFVYYFYTIWLTIYWMNDNILGT